MTPTGEHNAAVQVLVVEDDENLRLALADNLTEEGYGVHAVAGAAAALQAAAVRSFAVVVLDIMLPDGDGYSICKQLRQAGCQAGILMLTARTLEDDIVRGFDSGADDYLAKPYRFRELLARVGALARRGSSAAAPAPTARPDRIADISIDRKARVVTRGGEGIELTRTEFDLLVCLVDHVGEALARETILDRVWGTGIVVEQRTVDNFISSLKRKLGWREGCGFNIRAVRGIGYRFDVERRS
ncbi:MAG: response regulator transcription factor [Deltaproteobacteria bacterium]|nr:response regulator transcription factor [Deltaproteobacteria bacterium]